MTSPLSAPSYAIRLWYERGLLWAELSPGHIIQMNPATGREAMLEQVLWTIQDSHQCDSIRQKLTPAELLLLCKKALGEFRIPKGLATLLALLRQRHAEATMKIGHPAEPTQAGINGDYLRDIAQAAVAERTAKQSALAEQLTSDPDWLFRELGLTPGEPQ